MNKFSVKAVVPERKLVGVLYCDGSGIVVAKPNGALVQISKGSIYTLLTSNSNLKAHSEERLNRIEDKIDWLIQRGG